MMGVVGVATGLVHAPLTRLFPHHSLLIASGVLLSFYNAATAFTTSLALFVALQPVAGLSHLVLSTSTLASFSHAFDQREIGLAMGVAGSVNSIGDIIAPLVAGVLFNFVGLGGPRAVSALLILIGFSLFVINGDTYGARAVPIASVSSPSPSASSTTTLPTEDADSSSPPSSPSSSPAKHHNGKDE
jgi:MFS family permease